MRGGVALAESTYRRRHRPHGERKRLRKERGLPHRSEAEIARRAARRQAAIELLATIKLGRGCMDCGYRAHPSALEFDHRPGTAKRANVSELLLGSVKTLLDEVAKCDVVCANCHAIRTVTRWRDGTVDHPGHRTDRQTKAALSEG